MKKDYQQLQQKLRQVLPELIQAIENAANDTVDMCNVSFKKDVAERMKDRINNILSSEKVVNLENNFIPVQLLMVSEEWREIQTLISKIRG